MADLSKVIAALRCCLTEDGVGCDDCSYDGTERCVDAVMTDALALLEGIPRKCPECAHRNNYSWAEPCLSCVVGLEKNAQPSNWRWKYDSGSLEL